MKLELELPPDTVEAIARRVAELLGGENGNRWVRAEEAARRIGHSVEHTRRLGREGELETSKPGKYVLFLASSVDAYAAGERRQRSRPARSTPRPRRRSDRKRRRF
jgi:excisionase family DNA binding protein